MSDVGQTAKERGYWQVSELARLAGVTDGRIRQLLTEKRLRGSKVGRFWLIPYSVGLNWLQNREGD